MSNFIQTQVSPSATSYGGAGAGEAIMIVLNDILLVACAITLVTGYVLAAASLI